MPQHHRDVARHAGVRGEHVDEYTGKHRGGAGGTYPFGPSAKHRRPESSRGPTLRLVSTAGAALTLAATVMVIVPGLSPGVALAQGSRVIATAVQAATHLDGAARPGGAVDPNIAAGPTTAAHPDPQAVAAAPSDAQQPVDERLDERRSMAQVRASRAAQRATLERQRAALAAAHEFVLPVRTYRFSSPFGRRWGRLHAGNDFAAPIGTRLGSLTSGTVVFAGRDAGYGKKLEIRFWDGTVGWYGHMSRIDVRRGRRLAPGQRVGAIGNTGHSTGPHLHLEIHPRGGKPVDPRPWLARHGLKV